MADYIKLYPELKYFFSAYFHHDWKSFYELQPDTPLFHMAVLDFKKNDPNEIVKKSTKELETLLCQEISENDLREIVVHQLGANINASGLGLTYRKWLIAVLDILKG